MKNSSRRVPAACLGSGAPLNDAQSPGWASADSSVLGSLPILVPRSTRCGTGSGAIHFFSSSAADMPWLSNSQQWFDSTLAGDAKPVRGRPALDSHPTQREPGHRYGHTRGGRAERELPNATRRRSVRVGCERKPAGLSSSERPVTDGAGKTIDERGGHDRALVAPLTSLAAACPADNKGSVRSQGDDEARRRLGVV